MIVLHADSNNRDIWINPKYVISCEEKVVTVDGDKVTEVAVYGRKNPFLVRENLLFVVNAIQNETNK